MKKGQKKTAAPAGITALTEADRAVIANILGDERMRNGLMDALGFGQFSAFNFPQGTAFPGTQAVSDPQSFFTNLRWFLVSNFRQVLSQIYVEIGLVQTIVDVPVDDALRGGVDIKSKQLDEVQIEELKQQLEREDDFTTMGQAMKWNRLYGGAGVLILTDQDPEAPLEVENISEAMPLEFRAVDMWELFWDKQNTESHEAVLEEQNFEHYSYYGQKIHKSRVLAMRGLTAPSFIRPRLRGWGFSVVEILVRSINQYLKATDLGYEVLDEFKLDIYKIKNLVTTLLSPNGNQKVQQRIQLANWQKNYQNAIVMDAEDDYVQKQLSFAGLGEAMGGIRIQVAADLRMPMTKLFGISSAGFNSGEDDIEVYNGMVESQVRGKAKKPLLQLCEIRAQQLFGFVPDDLMLEYKPLRVLSSVDTETVKTQKFNRLIAAKAAGEISIKEFKDACNKGGLFDITLDSTTEELATGAEEEKTDDEKKTNSAAFDRASYEADGGDSQIDPRRREFFENPGNVDEALWAKAKEASMAAFGKERWQFVTWWYKKHGGKFS